MKAAPAQDPSATPLNPASYLTHVTTLVMQSLIRSVDSQLRYDTDRQCEVYFTFCDNKEAYLYILPVLKAGVNLSVCPGITKHLGR